MVEQEREGGGRMRMRRSRERERESLEQYLANFTMMTYEHVFEIVFWLRNKKTWWFSLSAASFLFISLAPFMRWAILLRYSLAFKAFILGVLSAL